MLDYIFELFTLWISLFAVLTLLLKPWKKELRMWLICIWSAYFIALLVLVFEGTYRTPEAMIQEGIRRINEWESISLKPFYTTWLLYETTGTMVFVMNIVGNIILFVPIGFGLPLLFRKFQKVALTVPVCLLLPILIESVQLFIGRFVDIDDVIYNFGGCMIGFGLYWLLRCINPTIEKLSRREGL